MVKILNPNNYLWVKFKNGVESWLNEELSVDWGDLNWEEEKRIFDLITPEELEQYNSINYVDKYNDSSDRTVLGNLSSSWIEYFTNPKKNINKILNKYFPE
jgi:hypothetical protein